MRRTVMKRKQAAFWLLTGALALLWLLAWALWLVLVVASEATT